MAATRKEMDEKLQEGTPPIHTLYQKSDKHDSRININSGERLASGVSGGLLAIVGLKKGGWSGVSLMLLGGGLLYRGLSGHSYVYDGLKVNTAIGKAKRTSVKHGEGIKVEHSVTINKSPAELYRFWRNFENLPRFMNHLESVQVLDNNLSHWVVKAPAGMTVEWDAQIINEKENELIAWRSLDGATIDNAGSVQFIAAPDGRGTTIKVEINYGPPVGVVGTAIAKLFGEEPGQQLREDLRRFKQLMESGEIASTQGQPSAREIKTQKESMKAARQENRAFATEDQKPAELILSHGR